MTLMAAILAPYSSHYLRDLVCRMRRRRGVGRRNFSHGVVASLSFPVQKPSLSVWPTFGPYSLSLTIFVIGGDGGRSLSFCAFRVSEALKSQRSGTTFSIQSRGIASRGAAVTRLFFTHLPASVNGSSFLPFFPSALNGRNLSLAPPPAQGRL